LGAVSDAEDPHGITFDGVEDAKDATASAVEKEAGFTAQRLAILLGDRLSLRVSAQPVDRTG